MKLYFKIDDDGFVSGMAESEQPGYIELDVDASVQDILSLYGLRYDGKTIVQNPYDKYGVWNGKQWVEDVDARKADEKDAALKKMIELEIQIMAYERVLEKIKSS